MSDPVSQIFDRYLDQPPTLPVQVRRRVEQACQGEIIQLYALADLDASLRLCQIWVTLTANHLAVIRVADRHLDEHIRVISRKRLEKIIDIYEFTPKMSISDAIQHAQDEYAKIDTTSETDRVPVEVAS